MADEAKKYNFTSLKSSLTFGKKLKLIAEDSKKHVREFNLDVIYPENVMDFASETLPDKFKLENLIKRQNIYGDITQNATKEELERLLVFFDNDVPKVIAALDSKVRMKGTRTFIPPAFYGRNGNFMQPPSFEMPASIFKPDDFPCEKMI